jgi:hypothetical protein
MMQVQFQGSLVKTKKFKPDRVWSKNGLRGSIKNFSKKSRKRLFDLVNSLNPKGSLMPLFVSLTYPHVMCDGMTAKRDLRTFTKRLLRLYPDAAILWRMEYQDRGAIHFHLLIWNVRFIPWEWIRENWRGVIGAPEGALATDIRRIYNVKHMLSYVSKYIAKSGSVGSFNSVPYVSTWTGRFWGIMGKDRMPWAAKVVIVMAFDKRYHDFRRACHRYSRWVGASRQGNGFSLYTDFRQLYEYCLYLVLN